MARKSFVESLTEGVSSQARKYGGYPMQTSLSLIKTALTTYRRWVAVYVLEAVKLHGVEKVEEELRAEVVDKELFEMMREKVVLSFSGVELEVEP